MSRWCQTIAERYESKVDRSGGPDACHPWTAWCDEGGYGRLVIEGKLRRVHRWAYKSFVGPIADDQVVRHACDNPPCQNPRHWTIGSRQDNVRDMVERSRQSRGESKPDSRLTPSQVSAIRSAYAAGGVTHRQLAALYDVSHNRIGRIVRRQAWIHVP